MPNHYSGRESRSHIRRDVCQALSHMRGAEEGEIRASVIDELEIRGIRDASESEISLLTDIVRRGGRRAGWARVRSQVAVLLSVANDVRTAFASDSLPEWASTPKTVPHAPEDDSRVGQQDFDLNPADLAMGRKVVGRILEEVSDQGGPEDLEPIRPLDCWLSVSANGTISVNVGAHVVGTLPTDTSSNVMAAIVEFGGNGKSLAADGDLLGDDASTAHLHLWAPTLQSQ